MPSLKLDSPLQYVKGVGPRKAEVLAEHGMETVGDLLRYYPRHYLDRTTVVPIAEAAIDRPVTVIGRVVAHGILHGRRKRYEAILQDATGTISLIWFGGLRFWQKLFKKGMVFAATGAPTWFQGRQMVHPDLERLEDDSDRMIHAGRIIPVYPQTAELTRAGLTSKGIRRVTSYITDNLAQRITDHLPERDRRAIGLLDTDIALRKIHYPDDREQIEKCRRRLAFDELLQYQFLIVASRRGRKAVTRTHRYSPPGDKMRAFREVLPFEFTPGQKRVIRELFDDMRGETPMSRLLQGDVGCGKTVVAIAVALYVAENDRQVAFMAPTEILAEQHYRNWAPLLEGIGVTCGLLTSSTRKPSKEKLARRAAEGELMILFGTHALIYDYIQFERLGLVIIDEQHRFGVQQRGKLHAKGEYPDLLAMTATPIPRTLALTLYGDLDISTIDDLPPGRKPVRTVWRTEEVRDKVYQFVREEVDKGGQAYFIYPVIEKSEKTELESVEDAYTDLRSTVFRDLRVGMVHGRVKAAERDKLLRQFHDGELDILLATTVIEVGLDNPNATVMLIEHAERFGLAQLHQLRGRIGRGEKQATLVAVAHPPLSDVAKRRLTYFTSTTDGFKIAEADLELRGPGEMFGTRQSGLPDLKVARLTADQDLIVHSCKLLESLFNQTESIPPEYKDLWHDLREGALGHELATGGG